MGLFVTLNSDDPPLFNTTLTDEYLRCAAAFCLGPSALARLAENAVRAAYLPAARKDEIISGIQRELSVGQ
jgi:aminodeoxyfutalosine deaminase